LESGLDHTRHVHREWVLASEKVPPSRSALELKSE
jgi:hypothetical protein